jgi:hypothetical protein
MKLNILNKTEPENQLKFIFGNVVNMTINRVLSPNPLKTEIA